MNKEVKLTQCLKKPGDTLTERRYQMKTINIPHKISAYAKTDEKTQPDLTVWTQKRIAEWAKVTRRLRSAISNLDHEIYFCCYPETADYMTTKPGREGNDK